MAVQGDDLTKGVSGINLNSRTLRKIVDVPHFQRPALNVSGIWGKNASLGRSSWLAETRLGGPFLPASPFLISMPSEGTPLWTQPRSYLCTAPPLNQPSCPAPGSMTHIQGVEQR